MNDLPKLVTLVGLTVAFANLASATGEEPPPPTDKGICHNIGGPRDLGANCDGTGTCTYTLDTGATITVAPGNFLGILIPPTSEGALAAHLAHGDGPVQTTYDPPLHLASTGGPHRASNVECVGTRVLPQPPEPGN
ncbi:hypothetical protein GCM10011487_20260 [Steroidobacter agaridevorans]|uniref:Uncharacterized protein n=1 Tax=Steroidobacter agaridevorans TaxID=2695856 RepID=A0A829YBH6_9GAMM|nr:hypothetical protein [Steroidobacter agaridevorans]GFE80026.1 hypothetical protein GCM10011487_20260 [Steroidobacter agaridevorans]GFE90004.1 hypothetical protein GCM10011488_49580 [Steroidobacter agaridevorans]